MLHWFRCENCYSFYDGNKGNKLSMVASNDNGSNNLREKNEKLKNSLVNRDGLQIQTVASIYGPNASGKSVFLRAIGDMFYNITSTSEEPIRKLKGERFRYDENLKTEPIFCEMRFSLPKCGKEDEYNEYIYGYELKTDESDFRGSATEVLYEWLFMKDLKSDDDKFRLLFGRESNREIDFSEGIVIDENLKEIFKLNLDKKVLVMKLVGDLKNGFLKDKNKNLIYSINNAFRTEYFENLLSFYNWCEKVIPTDSFTEQVKWSINYTTRRLTDADNNFKKDFMEFMKKFDPAIKDYIIKDDKLFVKHRNFNNTSPNNKFIDNLISEESYGTQKIVGMLPLFFDAFEKGGLLLIDELDIKLFSEFYLWLIDWYRKQDKKKNNKLQLIYSAHNLLPLDNKNSNIDEVYFIEKGEDNKSSIIRMNSESFTKEELEKEFLDYKLMYLNGRF